MFLSIFTAVSQTRSETSLAADLYDANRDAVEQQLLHILQKVVMDYTIGKEILVQVCKIAKLGAELALEIGVQRAQVGLLVAGKGTGFPTVSIGAEWHDCENGDAAKGTTVIVDLLVSPGLIKLGNGRGDMDAKRVLVPADVYSGANWHPGAPGSV